MYCHDNEHSRQLDHRGYAATLADQHAVATGNPFADIKALMTKPKP